MSIYSYTFIDNLGNEVSMSDFKGKDILIVNTASRCGFTKQYAQLQELHLDTDNLEVIAFPCNQFGNQEPGSDSEIKDFCETNHSVTFKIASKVEVNGESQHPIFKYLKDIAKGGQNIGWNFEKFLIHSDGQIENFNPDVQPKNIYLKNPKWTYINSYNHNNNEIYLSGFKTHGSIGIKNFVSFKDTFRLKFNFKLTESPFDHAALIDLDFNSKLHSFASLIYSDEKLKFIVRDLEDMKEVWSNIFLGDVFWHSAEIIIIDNLVKLRIDGAEVAEMLYQDQLNPCRVFLGNNAAEEKLGLEENNKTSIVVKNISITTDYGYFTLNVDNVNKFPEPSEGEK